MPLCAQHYARAVIDPFDSRAAGACVPSLPGRDTWKGTGWHHITMQIGSQGAGWVLWTPSLVSTYPNVWFTTGVYAGTDTISFTVTNTGTSSTPGVYSAAMANTGVQGASGDSANFPDSASRMVSAGLSIQCVDPLLEVGGTLAAAVSTGHQNMYTGSMNFSTLSSMSNAILKRVGVEPTVLVASAVSQRELNFSDETAAASSGAERINFGFPYASTEWLDSVSAGATYNNGAACGAVIVVGAPGTTFLVRLRNHFEISSRTDYAALATPNHLSPQDVQQTPFIATKVNEMAGRAASVLGDMSGAAIRNIAAGVAQGFMAGRRGHLRNGYQAIGAAEL